MVGTDRCRKCVTVSRSFLGMDFPQLVLAYQNDTKSFRDKWDTAMRVFLMVESERPDFGPPMSVRAMRRSGMTIEMTYWFLKVSQFLARFKVDPKAVGLNVTTMTDETGTQPIKGVIIVATPTLEEPLHTFRVVRLFHETVCGVSELMLEPGNQLRKDEPLETLAFLNQANRKKHTDPLCSLASLCVGRHISIVCFLGLNLMCVSSCHMGCIDCSFQLHSLG